jgi:hypothetical protein
MKPQSNLILGREDEVTETFTITCPKDVMERFKRFLAFFTHNGGHSGLFAMPFDGDGSDFMRCEPEIPSFPGMYDVSSYGDIEIAYDYSYGARKLKPYPRYKIMEDGDVIKTENPDVQEREAQKDLENSL